MAEKHILLVTFPAQGHINPSLQFAKRLTAHGVKVTLLTALFATSRMSKTLPSSLIDVVSFPTGFDAASYSPDMATEFMESIAASGSAAVESAVAAKIAAGNPYSRIVFNLLVPWAGAVARRLGVPSTLLWIQPAALFSIYFHYYNKKFDVSDEVIELPGLPPLRRTDLPSFFHESNPSFYDFAIPMFMENFQILDEEENPAVLMNTFDALEVEGLRFFKKYRLMPIGPLIPSAFLDGRDPSDTSFGGDLIQKGEDDDVLKYLDSSGAESVIYIAFGSYSELPPPQTAAIAAALIKTGRPFLWVIRGSDEKEKLDSILDDRREELERRGKFVAWCTQVEVLSHSSVGCFVTHCGWNSTLESLAAGVPVVALPQWTDQATNAKLVEDLWGSGVRAEKAAGAEAVAAEEIERCLEKVMDGGDESRKMREAARKWRDLARKAAAEDGTSTVNLKAFVEEIVGAGRQPPSV